MSTYFLAAPLTPKPPPPPRAVHPIPKLTLESMDGRVKIPLDGSSGWIRMPGATGLEMPPVEVVTDQIPGVPGSVKVDVRAQERPVFVPIYFTSGSDHLLFLQMKDMLRRLVDPLTETFKLVGSTTRGERELIVTYTGGLEGLDGIDVEGHTWAKVGLNAVAHSPYARDREDKTLTFRAAEDPVPFLGVVGGTDAPWPGMLASGAVIGEDMSVRVESEVPVYPTLELVGPMDSFEADLAPILADDDLLWYVNIPTGVPTGQTFRLVTDPRNRSARLNGALAAGRIALGSALRPFYPGDNVLNVAAPGSTSETRIVLSWREHHLSLW